MGTGGPKGKSRLVGYRGFGSVAGGETEKEGKA